LAGARCESRRIRGCGMYEYSRRIFVLKNAC
jgi:hypothetical protein